MDKLTMSAITTLAQLFTLMGVQFRIYDLGRRIEKLNKTQFEHFENLRAVYPHPYLQKAHLGIAFWQKESKQQPSIWFLRLPLDEQGLLVLSERDQFLQHLLMAVGHHLDAVQQQKQLAAVLEGNPYVFQPTQEKQAAFNAKIKSSLKLAPSQYFLPALQYLQQQKHPQQYQQQQNTQTHNWQDIGLQGLADIAARWQQHDCHQALLHSLAAIPTAPLISLCQCLENEALDVPLSRILLDRLRKSLSQLDTHNAKLEHRALAAACLRGLSLSISTSCMQAAVDDVLHCTGPVDIELLATLATRLGPQLINGDNPIVFMELLSTQSEQAFIGIMAELLYQPLLREPFLVAMRRPNRSDNLSRAIGALLQPSQALH